MENRIKRFVDELNAILPSNNEEIKEVWNSGYDYPALEPVRDEICKCYLCGLYQSTITLTNHFLEKSLKFCLSVKFSMQSMDESSKLQDLFASGIEKYDKLDLQDTINRACTQGLITKTQKRELISFKDKFRNPYSHANTKIFENYNVKGKIMSIKDLDKGLDNFMAKCFDKTQDEDIPLKNLPFAQGISQVEIARNDCLPYFIRVNNIIKDMLEVLEKNKD